MSAVMYDNAVVLFTRGELDWENADVRVLLLTNEYQPSQSHDTSRAGLRLFEVAPSGTYKRGGFPLTERQVDRGVANEVRLLGGSAEWDRFTGEFRYAVLLNAVDGNLIAYADLGHQRATNAKVTLEYDNGVAAFTVQPAL